MEEDRPSTVDNRVKKKEAIRSREKLQPVAMITPLMQFEWFPALPVHRSRYGCLFCAIRVVRVSNAVAEEGCLRNTSKGRGQGLECRQYSELVLVIMEHVVVRLSGGMTRGYTDCEEWVLLARSSRTRQKSKKWRCSGRMEEEGNSVFNVVNTREEYGVE